MLPKVSSSAIVLLPSLRMSTWIIFNEKGFVRFKLRVNRALYKFVMHDEIGCDRPSGS